VSADALTLIADRVAKMQPPVTHAEDAAYVEGHADALRRVESLLRWLARDVEAPPAPVAPPHLVCITPTGWTIQHPLACRPNLFACTFTATANATLNEMPPTGPGVYACDINHEGYFEVLEKVS
jgi:hypothetical protein